MSKGQLAFVGVMVATGVLAGLNPAGLVDEYMWCLRPLTSVPLWLLTVGILIATASSLTSVGDRIWRCMERGAIRLRRFLRRCPIRTTIGISLLLSAVLYLFRVRVKDLGDIDIIPWDVGQLRFATVAHFPLEGVAKLLFCRWLMRHTALSIEQALAWYAVVLGVLYFWCLTILCGQLRLSRRKKLLTFLTLWLAPTLQLYAGYQEHYGIGHLAHVAYFLAAIGAIQGRIALPVAAIWLAVAVSAHVGLGVLIPSALVLAGLLLSRRRRRCVINLTTSLILFTVVGWMAWTIFRLFNPYDDPIHERLLGTQFHGLQQGIDPSATMSLLDPLRLLDLLNELLFTSWPAWLLGMTWISSNQPKTAYINHPKLSFSDERKNIATVLVTALLGSGSLFLTWISAFTVKRDWDLYALIAPGVTLFILVMVLWRPWQCFSPRQLGTVIWISAFLCGSWIISNANVFNPGPMTWLRTVLTSPMPLTPELYRESLAMHTFLEDRASVSRIIREYLAQYSDRRENLYEWVNCPLYDQALGIGQEGLNWFTDLSSWHDRRMVVSTLDSRLMIIDLHEEGLERFFAAGLHVSPLDKPWAGTVALDVGNDNCGAALDPVGRVAVFRLDETENGVWLAPQIQLDLRPSMPRDDFMAERTAFVDIKWLDDDALVVMDTSLRFYRITNVRPEQPPRVDRLYHDEGFLLGDGLCFDAIQRAGHSEPFSIAVMRMTKLGVLPRGELLPWADPIYHPYRDIQDVVMTHGGLGALAMNRNGDMNGFGRASRWLPFSDWNGQFPQAMALSADGSLAVGLCSNGKILLKKTSERSDRSEAQRLLEEVEARTTSGTAHPEDSISIADINHLAETAEGKTDIPLSVQMVLTEDEHAVVMDRWGRFTWFTPGVGHRWLIERNPRGHCGEFTEEAVGFVLDAGGITVATRGGEIYRMVGNVTDGFEPVARNVCNIFETLPYIPYKPRRVVDIVPIPDEDGMPQAGKAMLLDNWEMVHEYPRGRSWRLYPHDWSGQIERIQVFGRSWFGPVLLQSSVIGSTAGRPRWCAPDYLDLGLAQGEAVAMIATPDRKAVGIVDVLGAVHSIGPVVLKADPAFYRFHPNVVDAAVDWKRRAIWMLDRTYGVRWGGLEIGRE